MSSNAVDETALGIPLPPAALLSAIVEASDDAIVSKDLSGVVTSWNRGAERIFGYSAAEMIGTPITVLIPSDRQGEEPKILERIRRGERVDHFQTVRVRKNGEHFDVSVTISPIKDATGRIVGASKIARDISVQKEAERALQRAKEWTEAANKRLQEVDRLKSEFLATMSHELRTPLNSIIGFSGILLQQIPGPLNAEQVKQMTMVVNSARHLLSLINDLLDLSRIEAGRTELQWQEVDVAQVIEEVLKAQEPVAKQKQLTLEKRVGDLPVIETDRKRIYQVLLNLVSNALKFTHEGGVKVEARQKDGAVIVEVTDTGIGIAPDQLQNLFQAFRQVEGSARRRYEGTGLGLYLCRKLLDLLGGEIRAESEPGKGSRFSVRLPLKRPVKKDQ